MGYFIDKLIEKNIFDLTEASEGEYNSIFISSKGVMVLATKHEDNTLTELTWQDFRKSNLPSKISDRLQQEFLSALLKQEKQFNKKVDYNSWVKKSNPSWEEKIDYILKNLSAKYTKKGIK